MFFAYHSTRHFLILCIKKLPKDPANDLMPLQTHNNPWENEIANVFGLGVLIDLG